MIHLLHRLSLPARRDAGLLVASLALAGCHASPPAPAPDTRTVSSRPSPSARPNDATPSIPATTAAVPASDSVVPRGGSDVTPVHTAAAEQALFTTADGYRLELVAAEPLVQDPVAIDFDADGRMYVVEMRGFMPNLQGTGEDRPIGRIVVLEDTDDDGKMDRKTIFLDSLVLPRSIKVLEHGVLVAETPNLWFVHDTNGDLKADSKELVRSDYGTRQSNPEHNANGLLWGIDNWIHNANYGGQFRLGADGKIVFRKTQDEGQWQVSSDEHGRLYRNSNEDPLRADLVPSHYAMRNPNLPSPRGIYEQVTRNVPVWPGHKTPAVNRGYREETLRTTDSTLAHYTSAGSPTAYVGDRLPAELRRSVFVTEPAGNLVGRMIMDEDSTGMPRARPAYDHAEFITNSDQRFRPVNLATAPDGTMYVVDMYRGIIQHRVFITGYLEQKIIERGMEQPVGLGRIWRVVHTTTKRGERPQLAHKSSAELVQLLAHPNGWWRTTAQRLLVERGDHSVAPALRQLARTNTDERARLHALWTLDGLGEADVATVTSALGDRSQYVRAAAIRIAEPWLAQPAHPIVARVLALASDRSPDVRRQLAASLGELPLATRDAALAKVIASSGDDPVVADMVVTGLSGHEMDFLERLLASKSLDASRAASVVRSLSGAVIASRDTTAVRRLVALVEQTSRPRWERIALMGGGGRPVPGPFGQIGAAEGAPPRGPRGGRGGFVVALPAPPHELIAAMASRDSVLSASASRFAGGLDWPGKSAPQPRERALTAEEQARYAAGEKQYLATCSACHQARGTGLAGVAKPLVGSPWVLGPPVRLIRIVLHGKEGEMLMPPIGSSLTNDQIANVLTYVRRSWGNSASPVTPIDVREVRGATAGRNKPWTEAELGKITR
jgi:mono/diheme cytochrome c family protein/glucose/arabinose dehydrogenase